MDLTYLLYMSEAEGIDEWVNTRQAKINAIGRELRESGYAGKLVPELVFIAVCRKHNIVDITKSEIEHIEKEWL